MYKLAIVIPAYKNKFFEEAIESIANQTNKEFILYIGDDCSSDNLYSIVKKYENRITIIYKYFDENLGGKNLVAQWERCIDLAGNEEWIWLFSDDDIMDPNCVKNFYLSLNKYPDFDLFHFNVEKIDESNNIINQSFLFPEILTVEDFLIRRLQGGINSYAVEFVFRKSHFYDRGRFQHFDLAWGSDDATWIKLGKKKGIKNIENSKVYWRESRFNISTNIWDKEILIRKCYAQIEFAKWLYTLASQNEIQIDIIELKSRLMSWFWKILKFRIESLSFGLIVILLSKFYFEINNKSVQEYKLLYLYFFRIYSIVKTLLKKLLFWDYFRVQYKIRKNIYH